MAFELSIRVNKDNPKHHLWKNRNTWWVHYCLVEDGRKRRVRFSLQTADLEVACVKRDTLLARLGAKDVPDVKGGQATPKAGTVTAPEPKALPADEGNSTAAGGPNPAGPAAPTPARLAPRTPAPGPRLRRRDTPGSHRPAA